MTSKYYGEVEETEKIIYILVYYHRRVRWWNEITFLGYTNINLTMCSNRLLFLLTSVCSFRFPLKPLTAVSYIRESTEMFYIALNDNSIKHPSCQHRRNVVQLCTFLTIRNEPETFLKSSSDVQLLKCAHK